MSLGFEVFFFVIWLPKPLRHDWTRASSRNRDYPTEYDFRNEAYVRQCVGGGSTEIKVRDPLASRVTSFFSEDIWPVYRGVESTYFAIQFRQLTGHNTGSIQ